MDYMFEDDLFEVGAEVDAYCTRCKTDTPHTVVTKYEDEIRSVTCTTCNTTHAYRPPRGETDEEIPEPIAVRRRQALHKLTWEAAMEQLDPSTAVDYSPSALYLEGQVIEHPTFGVGCVSEVLSDTKLEALFQDGRRLMVHNREDLKIVTPKRARKTKTAVARKAAPGGRSKKKAPAKPARTAAKAKPSKKPAAKAKAGSRTSTKKSKGTAKKPPPAKSPKSGANSKPSGGRSNKQAGGRSTSKPSTKRSKATAPNKGKTSGVKSTAQRRKASASS